MSNRTIFGSFIVSMLVGVALIVGLTLNTPQQVAKIDVARPESSGFSFLVEKRESLVVEENRIYLAGEVSRESADDILKGIKDLNANPAYKDILIVVNSPGGSSMAMLTIITAMLESNKPVNTYNVGMAASAASLIFAAGVNRTISPAALILTHEAKSFNNEPLSASAAHNTGDSLDAINENAISLLAQFTHKTTDFIKANLIVPGKDVIITPEKAVEFGLADKIAVIKVPVPTK